MISHSQYNSVHQWLKRNYNKSGICEVCRIKKRTEWSSKTHQYSHDRLEWQEVCRKCHRQYDRNVLGSRCDSLVNQSYDGVIVDPGLHGSVFRYTRGCRCRKCVAAHNDYTRLRIGRSKPVNQVTSVV